MAMAAYCLSLLPLPAKFPQSTQSFTILSPNSALKFPLPFLSICHCGAQSRFPLARTSKSVRSFSLPEDGESLGAVDALTLPDNRLTPSTASDDHHHPPKTTETEVIVVGAGPSGLATAACLTQNSIPYVVLEREDCTASLWKKKAYDRLHLHLNKQSCQLPHFPFPEELPMYVARADFVRYLDDYALRFRIDPHFNRTVTLARYDEELKRWRIKVTNPDIGSGDEEYLGRYLVVATGETSDVYMPEVEGIEGYNGKVIHSTEYKNGKEYAGKSVLVVGSGNSGMEIALDLYNYGANPSIVIRSPIRIARRWMVDIGVKMFKYLPLNLVDAWMVLMQNLVFGDLTKYGIQSPKEGHFLTNATYGKLPVIDVGTVRLIKSGLIQVLPALENIKGNEVRFANGKAYPFDAIIFATGFCRTTSKWLMGDDYLLNEDGFAKPSFPNHWKGKRGLYCVGLARKGLFGAAMDAQLVANDVKSLMS